MRVRRCAAGLAATRILLLQGGVLTMVCVCVPQPVRAQVPAARSAQAAASQETAAVASQETAVTASQEAAATPRQAAASLVWDERWDTFTFTHTVVTASMGLGIAATMLVLPEPAAPRWQGAILLDGDTRGALRRDTEDGRAAMGTASDAILSGLMAWPMIDAGLAWAVHGSPEAAAQMMAINAQSYALTVLVTELTKRLVGRERPYGQDCGDDATGDCGPGSRFESFISGHTSVAFTGAGLVCAHHQNLPLYGGGMADAAACATALGAATAVGALRIAADRHYLSDVIFGAALGLVSGYVLPSFLHYDIGQDDPDTGRPSGGSLSPIATPGGVGLGYQHVWY